MLDTACLLDKIKMSFNITKDIQGMNDAELKELFKKPKNPQGIIKENRGDSQVSD